MHPANEIYGCYSSAGERLASQLVGGVIRDIRADSIGRRAALVRLSDAIDRVSDVDEGIMGQDALESIARAVSGAFDEVGIKTVAATEIVASLEAWRREGAPAALVGTPHAVARLAASAKAVRSAMTALADVPGVRTSVRSSGSEWTGTEMALPGHGAAVFLQESASQDSLFSAPSLCGVIAGCRSAHFLDLLTDASPEDVEAVTGATFADPSRAARAIRRAASALSTFNLSSHLIGDADRLDVRVSVVDGLPEISVRWDGCLVPAEAVRSVSRITETAPDPLADIGSMIFGTSADHAEAQPGPAFPSPRGA